MTALLIACGSEDRQPLQPAAEDVLNHTGTIRQIGSWGFAIDDDSSQERFAPDSVPLEFQQDGLRVLFSGRRGAIAPNERRWGVPLELSAIEADVR